MRKWILAALAIAVPGAAAAATPHLTPYGWGAVKIGMTQAQVAKALGTQLVGEPIEDEKVCVEKEATRYPGLGFLFLDGRLDRISVEAPSRIATPRGTAVGASAAQVRRTYGRRLRAEWHRYVGRPAEYLTFWLVPGKRGVRFETGTNRRVALILAGGESIAYVEGCA